MVRGKCLLVCLTAAQIAGGSAVMAGNLAAKTGANGDVGLSNSILSNAYTDASKILSKKDSPQDIVCAGVTFSSSSGSSLSDPDLLLTINQQSDFATAAARGYKVNFMGAIRTCGGDFNPDFRGCKTGGRIYIRYPIPRLATTLVHEWGHFKGLGHAPKTSDHLWRIMYFQDNLQRAGVTASECQALTGSVDGEADSPATSLAQATDPQANMPAAANQYPPVVVGELLREVWYYGLPMPQIMALSAEQIEEVRRAFIAGESVDIYPNAVTVLGLRGARGDIQLLIDKMNVLAESKDPAAQEALLLTPIAIGRIAGRVDAGEGIQFLNSFVMRSGLEVFTERSGVSQQVLRENAIIGLAYSGRLNRSAGPINLETIRSAARSGAFNMREDEGFFSFVGELSDSVRDLGVVEKVTRDNNDKDRQ